MDDEERHSQDPDREWQEQKERQYQAALQAAESLYQLSLTDNPDEAKIKEYYKAITPLGPFQDRLVSQGMGTWDVEGQRYIQAPLKIQPQFFETLPVLNKLAAVHTNIRARSKYLFSREAKDISSSARYTLFHGLSGVTEETLGQLDPEKTKDFFESLKMILTSDNDYGVEEVINFLSRHRELFARLSQEKQLPDIQARAEELESFQKTREFEIVLVRAVQDGINNRRQVKSRSKAEIKYLEPQLREVIAKYGLDPDEIIDTWNGSYNEYGPQPQIDRNMEIVFDMEDQRPGITRVLYKEFGIRNFDRYPEAMLIAQYDEFDNTDKPYGVILQATHDWNGAFTSYDHLGTWAKLYEQIKDDYAFRVVEAKSKLEVAKRLITLDRKYGAQHKLAFAFIGGHGSKDSIMFGGQHRRNMLLLEDLAGKGVQRTGGFFEEHPTIVLASCSTGAEGGIGQELSRRLGAKVIAPAVPASFKSVEAIITEDGIDFKVEYGTKAGQNQEDVDRVYTLGKPEAN